MIQHVSDIIVVESLGAFTTAEFVASELAQVARQPGAIGTTLIKFRFTDHNIYDAAVGVSQAGPMLAPANLVAIPCPPICGGQGQR